MFAELVEFGKRETKLHPALAPCQCDYDIVIDSCGNFLKLIQCDCQLVTEYIPSTAKKGKVRLLLDRAEETLYGCDGYPESEKSVLFVERAILLFLMYHMEVSIFLVQTKNAL